MTVRRVVALSDDHVVVHLRPGWWARLFGAPDLIVELVWIEKKKSWVSKYSRQQLSHMNHGSLLREALEAHPIEPLPAARRLKE